MADSVQNKPEHRHVEFRDIPLTPCLVEIQLPENKLVVGRALVLHNGNNGQAVLWHIFVAKEYRRKEFGKALVEHLKMRWKEIATDMESKAGHELMIKCGFQSRKTDQLRLVWKRKE